jgi:hypothetical protein
VQRSRQCQLGLTSADEHSDPRTDDVPVEAQWSKFSREPCPLNNTSSEAAFEQIRNWIHECFNRHECCSKSTVSRLPKRILEIVGDNIYLQEQDSQAKYACLSHCWGSKGAALQLTKETIGRFRSGIKRSELPRTFRDALEVCTKLDICFLWIDAMCTKLRMFGPALLANNSQALYKMTLTIGAMQFRPWPVSPDVRCLC